MIKKSKKDVTLADGKTTEVDVFIETITTVQDIEISLDSIESQITQKKNTIQNLEGEIKILEEKKEAILALE